MRTYQPIPSINNYWTKQFSKPYPTSPPRPPLPPRQSFNPYQNNFRPPQPSGQYQNTFRSNNVFQPGQSRPNYKPTPMETSDNTKINRPRPYIFNNMKNIDTQEFDEDPYSYDFIVYSQYEDAYEPYFSQDNLYTKNP